MVTKFTDNTAQRFDAVQKQHEQLRDEHETFVRQQTETNKHVQAQIGDLQRGLVVAERPRVTLGDLAANDFSRDDRLNVLRISALVPVSKDAVRTAIAPWLSELGIPASEGPAWELTVEHVSKQHFLVFQGTETVGALRAKKANGLLYLGNRKWREIKAVGEDGTPQTLKIFRDQSPQHRAESILCLQIKRAIEAAYPEKSVFFNRDERNIQVNRIKVATVVAESWEKRTPMWKMGNLQRLGMDKEVILARVADDAPTAVGEDEAWCV